MRLRANGRGVKEFCQQIRSVRRRVAALTMFLALVGGATPAPAAPAAGEPYQIDVILSLTGPFSFLGNAEAASLRALEPLVNAEGGINGQPVHFAIQDDQSQPAVAVQLTNAIIAKHPAVMLGPTYSASCLAIAPLIKANNGPVQYCFAPTVHPPPGSYSFSDGASSRDACLASLIFAQAKGWKRVALIATTDSAGQDIEAQYTELLAEPRFSGITLVAHEHYSPGDVSVAAQVAKIKGAGPQVLLAAAVGTATGTLLHALGDAGLSDLPVITNEGNLLGAQLAQYAPIMPQQMYWSAPRFYAHDVSGSGPVRDAQDAFYRAFKKIGIGDPDVGNNFPWDPAQIVIAGLRTLGTKTDAKSLLAYIENVHAYAGTDGIVDFRDGSQRGQGLNSIVIVKWDAAKKGVVTVSQYGGKPLATTAARAP